MKSVTVVLNNGKEYTFKCENGIGGGEEIIAEDGTKYAFNPDSIAVAYEKDLSEK